MNIFYSPTSAIFLAAVSFCPFATAQSCFDSNPGTSLGAGDESVSAAMPLGFTFTWPDGSTSTDVVITSNGRVSSGSSGLVSSFNVGITNLLSDPTSIAAAWVDLDFGSAGDVTFFADPGGAFAVITYIDAEQFGGGTAFSMQIQLNADNTFALRYDDRVSPELDNAFAIAGFTAGNGALDPGGSDLSTTSATPIDTGMTPTAYEDFMMGVFDIGETEILVIPNGVGGYTMVSTPCLDNPGTTDLGGACQFGGSPRVAYRYIPDGSGGYTSIVDNSVVLDVNLGPSIGADIDTVNPIALGFPFTMPAGTVVTDLNVDSNGRVFLPTSMSIATFSPSIADMEAEEQIAVHWSDWITTLGGGTGDIHFISYPAAGRAVLTWNGTRQCVPSNSTGTFQLVMFGGSHPSADSFTISYEAIEIDPLNANTLIGTSDGTAGATELDLFPGPIAITVGGAHWEFFDIAIPEVFDIQPSPPGTAASMILTNATPPVIGTSFDFTLSRIPATAAFGGIGIGFTNLNAPLALIDPSNPCTLFSSLELLIPIAPGPTVFPASINLAGASPGLVGLTLTLQGIIADFSLPFAIQIVTSNGLSATLQ